MPDQVVDGLNCMSGKVYVDCTAGGGGHSLRIANAILPEGRLISLDVDEDAIIEAALVLNDSKNVLLIKGSYLNLPEIIENLGINEIDGGVLVDLGPSYHQLTSSDRGFSFQYESKLDMRMDKTLNVTAFDLITNLSADELANIFIKYGEERYSRRIAKAIKQFSENNKIETTTQLANIVKSVVPVNYKARIHPATRVFQALRIAVNAELETLQLSLNKFLSITTTGTRIAIITFHSLEDRIVKQFFKKWSSDCICLPQIPECRCNHRPLLKIINKKPIIATDVEVNTNPSARSAKLRIAERL
jgi:16S rRNA (cytosine1402-N4)-methyltransferase